MATRHRVMVVLCSGLIVSALALPAGAGEASDEAFLVKEGFYVGTSFVYNLMSGDFDDSGYYMLSDRLADVPEVTGGYGFGLEAGIRSNAGSMAFGYQRTTHDTRSSFTWLGEGGRSTATYNVVDLNFKFDLLRQYRVRPYIQFGFGFPWLTLKDSAMTYSRTITDVTYTGLCLNLGTGVVYYFHPRWALTAGVLYRWNWFGSASGDSIDGLSEHTVGFTTGIAFTF